MSETRRFEDGAKIKMSVAAKFASAPTIKTLKPGKGWLAQIREEEVRRGSNYEFVVLQEKNQRVFLKAQESVEFRSDKIPEAKNISRICSNSS